MAARSTLPTSHASTDPVDRRTVVRLMRLLVHVDATAERHAEHVTEVALRIGMGCDLSGAVLERLAAAAYLHDVGKMRTPERVLAKREPLLPEEWQLLRRHPADGVELLRGAAVPAVLEAVRGHHERWDGSGYPDGLRGREIPLLARIVAVADSFAAMTEDRPYRPALDQAAALAEIAGAAGTRFDPRCVELLLAAGPRAAGSSPEAVGV